MQLKNLSQVMECILSPYEDFRDRIVRRHLIGMHSIRSNPDSKDQNPHKTSVSYEAKIHSKAFIFMNVFWSSQEPSRNPHKY